MWFDAQRDMIFPPADEILRQRLLVYADQVLERNWKIERYASDLPSLAYVANHPAISSELRLKAVQISKAHAKNLKKELDKLEKSLKYAFPRSREDEDSSSEQKPSENRGRLFEDLAEQIAIDTRNITYRVNSFIHPTQHTVDLDELRRPSLLEAMEKLDKLVSDFEKAPAKSVTKQTIAIRK